MNSTHSFFLQALEGLQTDRIPLWFMRQAGRYLPEYQLLRKKHSLWQLFHSTQHIVDVTLMPLQRWDLDAAIIFSDILVALDLIGVTYDFMDQQGPTITGTTNPTSLCFLQEAIHQLKKVLTVPLLGFSSAPFTLASYYLDHGKAPLKKIHALIKQHPQQLHVCLELMYQTVIAFIQLQIDAGVDAIQIFESTAWQIDSNIFCMYALPYLHKVIEFVKAQGKAVILFVKHTTPLISHLLALNPTVISFDSSFDMIRLHHTLPQGTIIQGNLDPQLLLTDITTIKAHLEPLLSAMKKYPGYIFNLGHGILPHTPVEHISFIVEYVHNYKKNHL